jgi:phage baseplate assembly protein W
MAKKFININYPFKVSSEGFFLDLTTTTVDAVKADLQHLLLTEKGERFYMPDFGTGLKKFLFDPSDEKNLADIENELKVTVSKYLPGLNITGLELFSDDDQKAVVIRVNFSISDGIFNSNDFIELTV